MPPTYLSMRLIAHYQTATETCEQLAQRAPYDVTPIICQSDQGIVCLYPGDAGYESVDPVLPSRAPNIFTPARMSPNRPWINPESRCWRSPDRLFNST